MSELRKHFDLKKLFKGITEYINTNESPESEEDKKFFE